MDRVWTPVELIRWTEGYLAEKGFREPRLNAELLLAGVLRLKRLDLYLQFDRPLTVEELSEYKMRLKRRLRSEPLQYIEGSAAFRELTLAVDRRALIPRPETELLVGEVLSWAKERPGLEVVDIGTGSGAIALSLCREGRFGRVVATDAAAGALALAEANCARCGLSGLVEYRHGSLYGPLSGESFDVIVSNPPYVAEGERGELPADVLDWEPGFALFAGAEGLDVIRALVAGAPDHLRRGGLLALEIGAGQAKAVGDLILGTGSFAEPRIRVDYGGHDRIVLAERR